MYQNNNYGYNNHNPFMQSVRGCLNQLAQSMVHEMDDRSIQAVVDCILGNENALKQDAARASNGQNISEQELFMVVEHHWKQAINAMFPNINLNSNNGYGNNNATYGDSASSYNQGEFNVDDQYNNNQNDQYEQTEQVEEVVNNTPDSTILLNPGDTRQGDTVRTDPTPTRHNYVDQGNNPILEVKDMYTQTLQDDGISVNVNRFVMHTPERSSLQLTKDIEQWWPSLVEGRYINIVTWDHLILGKFKCTSACKPEPINAEWGISETIKGIVDALEETGDNRFVTNRNALFLDDLNTRLKIRMRLLNKHDSSLVVSLKSLDELMTVYRFSNNTKEPIYSHPRFQETLLRCLRDTFNDYFTPVTEKGCLDMGDAYPLLLNHPEFRIMTNGYSSSNPNMVDKGVQLAERNYTPFLINKNIIYTNIVDDTLFESLNYNHLAVASPSDHLTKALLDHVRDSDLIYDVFMSNGNEAMLCKFGKCHLSQGYVMFKVG